MKNDETTFALLSAVSAQLSALRADPEVNPWAGSPFEWIKLLPPRSKGAVGEGLVEGLALASGVSVEPPITTDHDRLLAGVKVEVKTSFEWESGVFTFQQLRDQDYEAVALLGLRPFEAELWIAPKREVWLNAESQHGGRSGNDTRWLTFPVASPPSWLARWHVTPASINQVLDLAVS